MPGDTCAYRGCEALAVVKRRVAGTDGFHVYCEAHDPLNAEAEVADHFTEVEDSDLARKARATKDRLEDELGGETDG